MKVNVLGVEAKKIWNLTTYYLFPKVEVTQLETFNFFANDATEKKGIL